MDDHDKATAERELKNLSISQTESVKCEGHTLYEFIAPPLFCQCIFYVNRNPNTENVSIWTDEQTE